MTKTATEHIREITNRMYTLVMGITNHYNPPFGRKSGYMICLYGLWKLYKNTYIRHYLFNPDAWSNDIDNAFEELFDKYEECKNHVDNIFSYYNGYNMNDEDKREISDMIEEADDEISAEDDEYFFPWNCIEHQMRIVNEAISSICETDYLALIDSLLFSIQHDVCQYNCVDRIRGINVRYGIDIPPEDKKVLMSAFEEISVKIVKEYSENFVQQTKQLAFDKRKPTSELTMEDLLPILQKMEDEAWEDIKKDNCGILSECTDMLMASKIDLFPIFRLLYMRSDWKPFLEACIKYKWCQDKIVELKNEKKKQQLLENNKELDEVRGYVDNMKGLDWKSPATKENITALMEALYSEDKFISLIKKPPKIGVANIIGYLVGNRYLKSQPKPISEQVFGDDKQVDSINHGKYGKSVSEEFRVLKETLDSFKDKYIEGVKE